MPEEKYSLDTLGKSWQGLVNHPAYKAATPEEQVVAKSQAYDKWVTPTFTYFQKQGGVTAPPSKEEWVSGKFDQPDSFKTFVKDVGNLLVPGKNLYPKETMSSQINRDRALKAAVALEDATLNTLKRVTKIIGRGAELNTSIFAKDSNEKIRSMSEMRLATDKALEWISIPQNYFQEKVKDTQLNDITSRALIGTADLIGDSWGLGKVFKGVGAVGKMVRGGTMNPITVTAPGVLNNLAPLAPAVLMSKAKDVAFNSARDAVAGTIYEYAKTSDLSKSLEAGVMFGVGGAALHSTGKVLKTGKEILTNMFSKLHANASADVVNEVVVEAVRKANRGQLIPKDGITFYEGKPVYINNIGLLSNGLSQNLLRGGVKGTTYSSLSVDIPNGQQTLTILNRLEITQANVDKLIQRIKALSGENVEFHAVNLWTRLSGLEFYNFGINFNQPNGHQATFGITLPTNKAITRVSNSEILDMVQKFKQGQKAPRIQLPVNSGMDEASLVMASVFNDFAMVDFKKPFHKLTIVQRQQIINTVIPIISATRNTPPNSEIVKASLEEGLERTALSNPGAKTIQDEVQAFVQERTGKDIATLVTENITKEPKKLRKNSRADRTNPRALGTNPRALGTNLRTIRKKSVGAAGAGDDSVFENDLYGGLINNHPSPQHLDKLEKMYNDISLAEKVETIQIRINELKSQRGLRPEQDGISMGDAIPKAGEEEKQLSKLVRDINNSKFYAENNYNALQGLFSGNKFYQDYSVTILEDPTYGVLGSASWYPTTALKSNTAGDLVREKILFIDYMQVNPRVIIGDIPRKSGGIKMTFNIALEAQKRGVGISGVCSVDSYGFYKKLNFEMIGNEFYMSPVAVEQFIRRHAVTMALYNIGVETKFMREIIDLERMTLTEKNSAAIFKNNQAKLGSQ